ncbi:MAG: hypothetical protein M3Y13_10420 [Armatimonadota bacterium]|nr:hypothetical protein [Armatimonadota bacterium]
MPEDNSPVTTMPQTPEDVEDAKIEEARKQDDSVDRIWRTLVNCSAALVVAFLGILGVLVGFQWHLFSGKSTEDIPNLSTLFAFAQAWILAVGFGLTGLQIRLARRQNKATEDQIRHQRREAQEQFDLAQRQFELAQKGYLDAQEWKMREFVTNEIRVFNDDPAVANVKRMLDGIAGGFKFETYIFVNESGSGGLAALQERQVTARNVINALTPAGQDAFEMLSGESEAPLKKYVKFESQIAGEFDRYFIYLISFDNFLATKAVTWEQLEPNLQYWLSLTFQDVVQARSDTDKVQAQLSRYIKEYYPYNFHRLKENLQDMQKSRAGAV